MIQLKPFRAWYPSYDLIQRIAALPYDSVAETNADRLDVDERYSFLQITRPELIDGFHSSDQIKDIYLKGAANLDHFFSQGLFSRDTTEGLFLYQMSSEHYSQTGLFSCISVRDYDEGRIIPHEHVHDDKVEERKKHILTQRAHAEPVMFAMPDDEYINEKLIPEQPQGTPFITYYDEDGVYHKIWRVFKPEMHIRAFESVDKLYIADGHHRTEAAARAAADLRKQNCSREFEYFPAVIFPMSRLKLHAYHRLILKTDFCFDSYLKEHFPIIDTPQVPPSEPGVICLYTSSGWKAIQLPESNDSDPVEQLDVSRLYKYLLEPSVGITSGHSSPDLCFVGGKDGVARMKQMVDNGKAGMAIVMYPPSIHQLKAVADSGNIMPPKSTWFEPKLRSGLLVHTF